MQTSNRYRWFVVIIFFFFMLLHQSDKLMIGPLTSQIMETYQIDEVQMGAVFTGALLVGSFLYPLWGFLYDRFARAKLLALASFIWGCTTWFSAIAPTYKSFVASRASTGVDDFSYPGLYSLIADYFGPQVRGEDLWAPAALPTARLHAWFIGCYPAQRYAWVAGCFLYNRLTRAGIRSSDIVRCARGA